MGRVYVSTELVEEAERGQHGVWMERVENGDGMEREHEVGDGTSQGRHRAG